MLTSGLEPLKPAAFDDAAARHLLNRAGFGGTPQQVRMLAEQGLFASVDELLDYQACTYTPVRPEDFDRNIIVPLTPTERAELRRARREQDELILEKYQRRDNEARQADRAQLERMRQWWLKRIIETPRPLEEKMTLFWHGHFASGARVVEDSWDMFQQNQLFRLHATGNFGTLAAAIVRDPAMLKYLDNDANRRGRPNENLARELMELFLLGVGNGYTEQDIKEGARALTGYTFRDNEFVFRRGEHDAGRKRILGQEGAWDGDDLVRLLLQRQECSEFICGKLYRFVVNDAPQRPAREARAQQEFVRKLAAQLRRENYELAPVLRTLFRSAHFYAPENRGTVIKSPVQLVAQTIRSYHVPARQLTALVAACDLMGQNLFQPPNVKGWDGGHSWINTSTLFVRQNVAIYLLTGRQPDQRPWESSGTPWSPMSLVEHLKQDGTLPVEATVDWLLEHSLACPVHPARRDMLLAFANQGGPLNDDRMLAVLALITALPEFQLC